MKTTVFFGISEINKEKLLHCMSAETKNYSATEIISNFKQTIFNVGIVSKGRARLSCIDIDGNERILEYYDEGDIFGEMFYIPIESMVYFVTADTDCEVMYIDYGNIVKRCENACIYHSQLVNNLFRILANKMKQYNLHISILGQKSIRKKIQAYLEYQSIISSSPSFSIPMSLSEFSSYLCVDRCALMREIKNMKQDGIIASKGRKFRLL